MDHGINLSKFIKDIEKIKNKKESIALLKEKLKNKEREKDRDTDIEYDTEKESNKSKAMFKSNII